MLNETLYKNDVIIFLGVGASAPLGMKTTVQFIDWVKNQPEIDLNLLTQVISNVKPSEEIDKKVDIEAVLDYLDIIIESSESYKQLFILYKAESAESLGRIVTLRNRIRDLIVEHYSELDINKAYRHYAPLFEGSEIRCLPIFTTNYDLSIEKAYEHSKAQFHLIDGFKKTRRTIPYWSKVEYNNYKPVKGKEIILYKLHGSVDWVRAPNGEIQRVGAGKRNPGNLKTVVVYPTRTKKEIHEEPFRTNYNYLLACLTHAKLCLVIGFSFRDQEITEYFRAATEMNKELKLLIANTNKEVGDYALREFSPNQVLSFMQISNENSANNIKLAINWLNEIAGVT